MSGTASRRCRRLAAAALMASVVAGCGATGSEVVADKVGQGRHLTLVLAHNEPDTLPAAREAERFAAEVERRSNGAMKVEIDSGWTPVPADDALLGGLGDGRYDVGLVPVSTWVGAGVTSLQPLRAPFELLTTEHLAAVAQDEELVSMLFDGLPARGVDGLALLPESLRFLFSFRGPITQPADLQSATVWSRAGDAATLYGALGAEVVGPQEGGFVELAASRVVTAVDGDLTRVMTDDALFGTVVTADLPIVPKFLTLVVNADRWQDLTAEQRTVLRDAATATRDAAIAGLRPVAGQMAAFCEREGAVVMGGAQALSEFRSLVAPMVDAVDQDALERVRADAPVAASLTPTPCDGRPAAAEPATSGGGFPDGIYRTEWTAAFAREWNATHDQSNAILITDADLASLPAVVTWTMAGGRYDFSIEFDGRDPLVVRDGRYRSDSERLWLDCLPDVCAGTNVVRWKTVDGGSLDMRQDDGRLLDPYFGLPWVRVGDVTAEG